MGRILGIDYGTRRMGAAISDPGRSIASPLEVYERRTPALDEAHYRRLIEEEGIERIVIGLPLHTGGGESAISTQARAWGARLTEITGRPVVYFDERYTSIEADEAMRASGMKAAARKAKVDMLAARILLQDYLDAGCPEIVADPGALSDRRDERRRS